MNKSSQKFDLRFQIVNQNNLFESLHDLSLSLSSVGIRYLDFISYFIFFFTLWPFPVAGTLKLFNGEEAK